METIINCIWSLRKCEGMDAKVRWKIGFHIPDRKGLSSIETGRKEERMSKGRSSVQFSLSVRSESLKPHALKHASLPCPSPIPGIYSKSCPSTQWCHPTISSSADPFSSLVQSFPGSGSFPSGQFFAPGVQSIILTLIPSIWMCSCKNSHELFALLWPNNTPKEADLLTTSQKSVKQTFQSPRLRHMVFKISL